LDKARIRGLGVEVGSKKKEETRHQLRKMGGQGIKNPPSPFGRLRASEGRSNSKLKGQNWK
jgi:hypothetical protein